MIRKILISSCIWFSFSAQAINENYDPVFRNLVEEACSGNNSIVAHDMKVQAASELLNEEQANVWVPEVDLGLLTYYGSGEPTNLFALQGVNDPSQPDNSLSGAAIQGNVDINWNVYKNGKWIVEDSLDLTEAQTKWVISRIKLENEQNKIINEVARYYFEALMYSAQKSVLEPFIQKRRQQLETIQNKISAGVGIATDFYTAETAYLVIQEQQSSIDKKLKANLGYLKALIGNDFFVFELDSKNNLEILQGITQVPFFIEDSVLLSTRDNEVAELDSVMTLEKQKIKVLEEESGPSLDFYIKFKAADDFEQADARSYGEMGVQFLYPFNNKASSSHEIKSLQKTVSAMGIEIDYLKKIKALQIEGLMDNVESAKSKIKVALSELNKNTRLLERDQAKLKSGYLGLEDLVDVEDKKIQAEISLIQAYKDAWLQYTNGVLTTSHQSCTVN